MTEVLTAISTMAGGGYAWSVVAAGPNGTEVTHYRTNPEGYGLWSDERQILGTSQFNLADCSASTRRRRVARFMAA